MKLQPVAICIHAGSLLGVPSSASCPPAELGLAARIDGPAAMPRLNGLAVDLRGRGQPRRRRAQEHSADEERQPLGVVEAAYRVASSYSAIAATSAAL